MFVNNVRHASLVKNETESKHRQLTKRKWIRLVPGFIPAQGARMSEFSALICAKLLYY
jgi:hypothetical protein